MKAKVLMPFFDNKEKLDRKVGDVIEVTKERFEEINCVLGDALEAVVQKKAKAEGEK